MAVTATERLVVAGDQATLRAGDLTLRLDLAAGARVIGATCAARPDMPLLDRWWCGYEVDGQVWSDAPRANERPFGIGRAQAIRGRAGSRDASDEVVEIVADVVAAHLRVAKRFTVYPGLPFVRVRYRIETTGVEGRGPGFSVGLPAMTFTDVLADAFDLLEDTADDGLDLGGGLALPAWRAFGDPNGEFGLLLFAAERRTMSRLQVTGRGCAFRPPYYLAYSTNVVTTREVRFGLEHQNYGPVDELDWFIGAFRREELPALRRLIAAFHARRRPAGKSEALELVPGISAWDDAGGAVEPLGSSLAPILMDALPRAWPAIVTLPAGGTTTRHFSLPDGAGISGSGGQVAVSVGGVSAVVQVQDDEGAGQRSPRLRSVAAAINAAPDAPTGIQRLTVPLPVGELDLHVHVSTPAPLPSGDGHVVLGARELAELARAAGWHVVDAPELPGGAALLQLPGGGAQPIRVAPKLRGRYEIYAGVGQGAGVKYRLDGDPYWSYVHAERSDPRERVDIQSWQPVESVCHLGAGSAAHGEVLLRPADFDGGGLQLAPHPYRHGYTVLSHVRFVPAPAPAPLPALHASMRTVQGDASPSPPAAPPPLHSVERGPGGEVVPRSHPPAPAGKHLGGRRRVIAGLADIPDIGNDIGADALEEAAWREVVAQHARAGIDTIYWRVDGQCSDFHTKIGTVRYSVPRTHGLYSPRARTYGRALERLDPLRIAVDEKRRWGLRLLGWMRTNNYSGNVVSRFFVEHPEWHERRADGSAAPQLCLAVPEVREHKAAILREAVAYGLDGLMIDTLRHPPMVGYHPVVVEAYTKEAGEAPPREVDARSPQGRGEPRTGERWERWYRFRARYFTQFIRDIRAGLAAGGYGHLPVHVRVAPVRYLHDGADLEALLGERLIDAVVANRYVADPLEYERLFPVVRDRVPVIAIGDPIRGDPPQLLRDLARDPRLGGVGVYESNRMVHTPPYRDTLLAIARALR